MSKKNIKLIVTGKLEEKGLSDALALLFPNANFLPPQYVDGFTSNPIRFPFQQNSRVHKVAKALVAAVFPERHSSRPISADMAILVEDIELDHMDTPEDITRLLHDAVRYVLFDEAESSMNQRKMDERIRRVREQCSFHLLSPMMESYFFASFSALAAAGVQMSFPPSEGLRPFDPPRVPMICPQHPDLESFQVIPSEGTVEQPAYAERMFAQDLARRDSQPFSLEFHPKKYLEYLCNPQKKRKSKYKETKAGVKALRHLTQNNWQQLLGAGLSLPYLGAMLEDIADCMGVQSPYHEKVAPLTGVYDGDTRDRILRNI
ncbi:MAG: hypothetical protein CL920_00520 [Deltaproteobacteria bacterium]|nr:hypothetical protein [Deltaproteobacteria bacterium]|tara:strand:+ start:21826 stop:22779 length:954 start_codon:yes stop_codon:yes gene_type:complete